MRTAVLISGQTRTFAQVFENQYFYLYRKLEDPEFFVSVEDDAQAPAMRRLLEKFPADRVHIEVHKQFPICEPAPTREHQYGYMPSADPQAILRQLWALNQVWNLFIAEGGTTDRVIRMRPDLRFLRCEMPRFGSVGMHDCCSPWWSRWGGINDRMAVMGTIAAGIYFNTFTHLAEIMALGCPLHPETLIATQLTRRGITISHTLAAEFVAVRMDGTTTKVDPTLIDVAEYARTR